MGKIKLSQIFEQENSNLVRSFLLNFLNFLIIQNQNYDIVNLIFLFLNNFKNIKPKKVPSC